jgi:hypothetical protein
LSGFIRIIYHYFKSVRNTKRRHAVAPHGLRTEGIPARIKFRRFTAVITIRVEGNIVLAEAGKHASEHQKKEKEKSFHDQVFKKMEFELSD